jgi:hypothetical protein
VSTNVLERKTRDRLRRAEQHQKARIEDAALQARLEETAGLAIARGEQVEAANGRVRIKSRDGLQSLYESHALDEPQYQAGLRYRKAFETLQASPRSNLNRDVTGGGEMFATVRAERALDLAEWEGMADGERQRWVLRLVAGNGRTITSISAGKSAERDRNTKALGIVLRQIAIREKLCRAA